MNATVKKIIYNQIIAQTDTQLRTIDKARHQAKHARNNDTKSSAGDKFETSRERIQKEIDRLETQYGLLKEMKMTAKKINLSLEYKTFVFGSLALTSTGNYFLSVAIGKIQIIDKVYYAISPQSPIAQALLGKAEGDVVEFQDKSIKINKII